MANISEGVRELVDDLNARWSTIKPYNAETVISVELMVETIDGLTKLAALLATLEAPGAAPCGCDSSKGILCDAHDPIMQDAEKSLMGAAPAPESQR